MLDRLFAKKIDKNQFANLVAKAMEDAGVSVFHYDEPQFALKLANGNTVFLDNVFANFGSTAKSERNALIQRFVAGVSADPTIPVDFVAAKERLIPIIRSASYLSLTQLQARADGTYRPNHATPCQTLSDDLVVCLAYDSPDSFSIIIHADFDRWSVPLEDAILTATSNLRALTDTSLLAEETTGVYVGGWGDSYESSRMLLPELVDGLSIDGEPVACLPSRNTFWITGSENPDGLRAMLETAEETHFKPYPLSPDLFVLRDGSWQTFVPEDVALRNLLAGIQRRRQALDYGQQKGHLEAIYEKETIDVFVASYSLYETEGVKEMFSICVWSKDVDSLLPHTDRIVILIDPESKDRVNVPWELAVSVVGHLMQREPDLAPERFRVRSFPSDAEIVELRRRVSS